MRDAMVGKMLDEYLELKEEIQKKKWIEDNIKLDLKVKKDSTKEEIALEKEAEINRIFTEEKFNRTFINKKHKKK
jgi:hypothetical protein